MKILVILILSSFLVFQSLFSQNLIPDPSFEVCEKCPRTYTQYTIKKLTSFWYVPTRGTSDYYNKCCRNNIAGVPKNISGIQFPHSGNAYAGIILRGWIIKDYNRDYREYLQTRFIDKMIKDKLYCVKSYICLSSLSEYTTNSYGMYISKRRIRNHWTEKHLNHIPQITYTDSMFLDSKKGWTLVCGVYKAKGSEEYITLGNFNSNEKTKIKKIYLRKVKKQLDEGNAYVYVDDVSVELINDSSECQCQNLIPDKDKNITHTLDTTKELKVFDTFVLKNILFETGKAILLSKSINELDNLVFFLRRKVEIEIEVNGHTDNIGNDNDNLKLSEERAKAVVDYFISKGIDSKRLTYKGYGDSIPIETNDT